MRPEFNPERDLTLAETIEKSDGNPQEFYLNTFVMSLPISYREYTASKITGNSEVKNLGLSLHPCDNKLQLAILGP